MDTYDLLVIGAGPSGLAAAVRAISEGEKVCLIEKQGRSGGSVQTIHQNGFLAESGPNTLVLTDDALQPLLDAAGVSDQLIAANPAARSRFIVRKGQPHALPQSPLGMIRTPIFTARGKLRLLGDLFKAATPYLDQISLGGYVRERFGTEALDYALNPLIGGIYAGDPEQLSLRYAFPSLYGIASSSRSLVLGGLRAARQKRRRQRNPSLAAQSPKGRRMLSLPGGLGALTDALAQRIEEDPSSRLQLNTTIQRLSTRPNGRWRADFTDRNAAEATRLVLAIPGHALANLPLDAEPFPALAAKAAAIRYPAVTSVSIGYPRQAIQHPLGGFGALIPEREGLSILGVLFASELFPGRAPEGHTLLTCFTGGIRQPAIAELADPVLLERVQADLRKLLGVSGNPSSTSITRWPRAIPQYDATYGDALAAFEAFEAQFPSVKIAGQVRNGISLPNSLLSGWVAGAVTPFANSR